MQTTYVGRELVDDQGNSLGKITDVISDPSTLEPEFITVKPGRLRREHIVPVDLIDLRDNDTVTVAADADTVGQAPSAADHTTPTTEEREEIRRHYGLTTAG